MAVGGIGSYGNYFNYQQTVSRIRLEQALSKNTRYQASVTPVQKVEEKKDNFKSSSMEFLKSYSTVMSDAMGSSNALRDANRSGVMRELTVESSDASVAAVTERYTARNPKELALQVFSLAETQQNVSSGVKGSDLAVSDMDFIVSGNASVRVSFQNEDGFAKTNREMIREAAKQINQADAGVIASVGEENGITTLRLESSKTGTSHAFTVEGQMGAAAGAEQAAKAAADAQYAVTENKVTRNYTSQSNDITLDAGRIGAKLKTTGDTEITVQQDNEKIASAVVDLIDSYNSAVKFLKDNTDHGSGVRMQLSNFNRSLAHENIFDRLGISTEKDGSLSVDKEVLKKSLNEDPALTKQLISGSFGLAQTVFNRAQSSMRTNSAGLIDYDLQQMEQQTVTDPIGFMNLYSRTGAYNMNNYTALGLMMNYLV